MGPMGGVFTASYYEMHNTNTSVLELHSAHIFVCLKNPALAMKGLIKIFNRIGQSKVAQFMMIILEVLI